MSRNHSEVCIQTKEKYIELLKIMSKIESILGIRGQHAWSRSIQLIGTMATIGLLIVLASFNMAGQGYYLQGSFTSIYVLSALIAIALLSHILPIGNHDLDVSKYSSGDIVEPTDEELKIIMNTYRRLLDTRELFEKILSRCSDT